MGFSYPPDPLPLTKGKGIIVFKRGLASLIPQQSGQLSALFINIILFINLTPDVPLSFKGEGALFYLWKR